MMALNNPGPLEVLLNERMIIVYVWWVIKSCHHIYSWKFSSVYCACSSLDLSAAILHPIDAVIRCINIAAGIKAEPCVARNHLRISTHRWVIDFATGDEFSFLCVSRWYNIKTSILARDFCYWLCQPIISIAIVMALMASPFFWFFSFWSLFSELLALGCFFSKESRIHSSHSTQYSRLQVSPIWIFHCVLQRFVYLIIG